MRRRRVRVALSLGDVTSLHDAPKPKPKPIPGPPRDDATTTTTAPEDEGGERDDSRERNAGRSVVDAIASESDLATKATKKCRAVAVKTARTR